MRNNELSEGSSLSQGDSVALASYREGSPPASGAAAGSGGISETSAGASSFAAIGPNILWCCSEQPHRDLIRLVRRPTSNGIRVAIAKNMTVCSSVTNG